ncbi:hypothetical protein XELAEV_18021743mg, partial [Xenopus laevis]
RGEDGGGGWVSKVTWSRSSRVGLWWGARRVGDKDCERYRVDGKGRYRERSSCVSPTRVSQPDPYTWAGQRGEKGRNGAEGGDRLLLLSVFHSFTSAFCCSQGWVY